MFVIQKIIKNHILYDSTYMKVENRYIDRDRK